MKIKKIFSMALAVVILMLCSGCSLNFFSVESLMSPPSQSGKNGEVEKNFKKLMSDKTVQLRTPASGDYQTAYILYDINGDGSEEAFVFYTDSSVDASVRMAFLECINGTWVISADVKGGGSSVYDVSFADLNNDGLSEVFVSWSLFESKTSRILSIYKIRSGSNGVFTLNTLDTMGNEYFNAKAVVDFNGDGKKDIVLINIDDSSDVQKSFFRCFSLNDSDELVKFAETKIDSSITTVSNIQCDTVKTDKGETARVFIDCLKTDSAMFTEMLYWNSSKLTAVRAIKNPSVTTLRNSKVICRDIDGDGVFEIPVNTKLNGTDANLTAKVNKVNYTFTMLKWINSTGDKSEGNIYTLYNPIDSYLYRVTRFSDITVKYDALREALLICLWDDNKNVIKEELLSVSYKEKDDDTENLNELIREDKGAFYYNITDYGRNFGITDEGVKSSFIIIE